MPGLTGLSIQPIPFGGGGVGCPGFELLARFNVANQGYANGQVLVPATGCDIGSLTVVDTGAGSLSVVGQELVAVGSHTFGQTGFYSQAIVRTLGKALLFKCNPQNSAGDGWVIHWGRNAAVDQVLDQGANWWSSLRIFARWNGWAATRSPHVADYATLTDYDMALVLGGYDANEQPWYSGAVGTFIHGASLYIRGGAFANWTLLWRWATENTTPLYVVLNLDDGDVNMDDVRVPLYVYSGALQPVNVDWFTDSNGTSLDAHTPDVGGGWTEHTGDWDIQGNQARQSLGASAPYYVASVDAGESDALVRVTVTTASGSDSATGAAFRVVDASNYWLAIIYEGANLFRIIEVTGGIYTYRAGVGVTIAQGTPYEITVITDGQDMQAFVDGGSRLTWTSAVHQAATRHGIAEYRGGACTNDNAYDNFHIHAREGYSVLDNCP